MNLFSRLIFIGLLALSSVPLSAAAQGRNLLKNPGFEGDYQIQCSFPGGKPWLTVECNGPLPSVPWQTVRVAEGWVAWWQPPSTDRSSKDFYQKFPNYCGGDAPDGCVAWHQPEWQPTRGAPQDPPRIRSGENSQKYFTFWSVHQGGVYQVVEGVRPGTPLRFSIYMHAWSATRLGDIPPNPRLSFGQTGMHMKVGIDPTGGTDPWSADIVWSDEKDVYDKFQRFEVQAVARANKVTVYTHSRPENPMMHNDVYLDDAELTTAGGVGPSEPLIINPPPALQGGDALTLTQPVTRALGSGRVIHVVRPGDTLFAIALQYGVPVDQIMALNDLTPESQVRLGQELLIAEAEMAARPLPSPGGVEAAPVASVGGAGSGLGAVCVQAFDDVDGNGQRYATEAPLAASGLRWLVRNAQGELIGDFTAGDDNGAHCFADLPATTYHVEAQTPIGWAPTLAARWAVALTGDSRVAIQLGLRPVQIESAIPSAWLLAGAGGVVLAAAVGLWAWRRRTRLKK